MGVVIPWVDSESVGSSGRAGHCCWARLQLLVHLPIHTFIEGFQWIQFKSNSIKGHVTDHCYENNNSDIQQNDRCIISGGVLMYGIKESHEGRYNQHNRRYSQRLYAAIDKCSSGLLDYTSNRVSNESNIYYCNLINDSLFSSPSSFSLAVSGLLCRRCAEMFARAGYCWTTRCCRSRCLKQSLELHACLCAICGHCGGFITECGIPVCAYM